MPTPEDTGAPGGASEQAPGAGRPSYIWSRGAWFGPVVGCTLWMLPLAVVVAVLDGVAAGVVATAYVLANLLGFALWRRRDRMEPTPALLVMLGVTGLLALGALLFVDARIDLSQLGEDASRHKVYGALIMYPVLMFVFWFRDRAVRP